MRTEDQMRGQQHAACSCGCCGPANQEAAASPATERGVACMCGCGCATEAGCTCGCAEAGCACGCAA